jgi:CxxC-x17-CxxC domain-containing protein
VPDDELVCKDCGSSFVFTEAEREFFRAQGFTNPPKRCKACRAKARSRRGGGSGPAEPREPPPRPPRTAEPPPAQPRPAKPRGALHAATCSLCGEPTEVPFLPDGVRPVYCLPCLKKQTR